jgi:hypothetical protein
MNTNIFNGLGAYGEYNVILRFRAVDDVLLESVFPASETSLLMHFSRLKLPLAHVLTPSISVNNFTTSQVCNGGRSSYVIFFAWRDSSLLGRLVRCCGYSRKGLLLHSALPLDNTSHLTSTSPFFATSINSNRAYCRHIEFLRRANICGIGHQSEFHQVLHLGMFVVALRALLP